MENLSHLMERASLWLTLLKSPASQLQFALIAVAFVVALLLDRRLRKWVTSALGDEGRATVKSITMRGSQRLILPLAMLLVVILFKGILAANELEVWLFDILGPLLLSLAFFSVSKSLGTFSTNSV